MLPRPECADDDDVIFRCLGSLRGVQFHNCVMPSLLISMIPCSFAVSCQCSDGVNSLPLVVQYLKLMQFGVISSVCAVAWSTVYLMTSAYVDRVFVIGHNCQ